jgi:hypothetical protein
MSLAPAGSSNELSFLNALQPLGKTTLGSKRTNDVELLETLMLTVTTFPGRVSTRAPAAGCTSILCA